MGLFTGRPLEKRYNGFTAQFANPPILPNSASGGTTPMNLSRAENSLQKIAIWVSVQLIAGLAAELPLGVFSGKGQEARPISTPGYLEDVAGDGYGTSDWIFAALVSYLLRGNLYGKILDRSPRGGFPTQVSLYHPDEVWGWRDPTTGKPTWKAGGDPVDAADMFHRRMFVMPGRLLGLSPIGWHTQTIGLGLSAEQFGVEFFVSGANPTGLLVNSETDLSPDVAQVAKERFVAALNKRREPVTLGKGWEWKPIAIKPEESQFLETQKYTEAQCARLFGPGMAEILGYDSGSSMTYTNVENRNIHLLTYTLDPWFSRVERALSSMLPAPQTARFDRNALLRTDLLTRLKSHATAIAARIMAPSECRPVEGLPPMTPEQLDELKFVPTPVLSPLKVTPPTK